MTVLTTEVIEECHWCYKNTNMNQTQISRRLGISQGSVAKALKKPSNIEFNPSTCTPVNKGIL